MKNARPREVIKVIKLYTESDSIPSSTNSTRLHITLLLRTKNPKQALLTLTSSTIITLAIILIKRLIIINYVSKLYY